MEGGQLVSDSLENRTITFPSFTRKCSGPIREQKLKVGGVLKVTIFQLIVSAIQKDVIIVLERSGTYLM